MKALVAAFVAVSLSVLCAEQVSARGMRGSGQSGRAGLSHSSGRPAHSSGSPAHFGRSGVHLKLGGHPFRRHRFGYHPHFEHKRLFLHHHHIGHHGFFLHQPFGFRSRLFFGQHIIGVAPSSAIIWTYPEVPSLVTPGEVARWLVRDPHGERPLITLMLRHGAELRLSPDQLQSLEELRADFQREESGTKPISASPRWSWRLCCRSSQQSSNRSRQSFKKSSGRAGTCALFALFL